MSSSTQTTIYGNATRDPELRFLPSGTAMCTFAVAANRRWQNRQTQEWEEEVAFLDVVCWAQTAENVAESISKGARVIVTGRISQRSWESQDGTKHTKLEIIADEVGPSLKYATAVVTKTERTGVNAYESAPKTNSRPTPAPAYSASEEPF